MSKTTEWLIDQIERGRTERWSLENQHKNDLAEIGRLQRETEFLELQLQKAIDMAGTTREGVEFAATFDLPLHPTTNIQASTNLGAPREPEVTESEERLMDGNR